MPAPPRPPARPRPPPRRPPPRRPPRPPLRWRARPSRCQQAVETVRLTIGASAQRGVTRARIALRPEELGGVEVHLRHTAEGLSARVVAEAPEAARLLSQAAGELRRTLEQQGLNLVRIEVGTAGSDAAGTGTGAAGSDQRDGRRGPSGQAGDPAGAETDLPIADRTIELPNGALVDVLA